MFFILQECNNINQFFAAFIDPRNILKRCVGDVAFRIFLADACHGAPVEPHHGKAQQAEHRHADDDIDHFVAAHGLLFHKLILQFCHLGFTDSQILHLLQEGSRFIAPGGVLRLVLVVNCQNTTIGRIFYFGDLPC